jgi:hypothetical protein
MGRAWREGSFTADREEYAKKGSGNGRLFPLEPLFWGTWRDVPFLVPLREIKNSLLTEIFVRNLRDT